MRRVILGCGAIVLAAGIAAFGITRQEHSPSLPAGEVASAAPPDRSAPADAAAPRRPAEADGVRTASPVFTFRRLLIDSSGEALEACFRFTQPLDARAEAHYEDYLRIDPEVPAALRVSDADLCLGGLAYGTSYRVTLAKGLPAQSGARTEQDETLEVSLGDRPALVAISGDGFILPRAASNGVTIQTVNVDRVKVRVLRMSDRLLPRKIRGQNRWDEAAAFSATQINRYQIWTLLRDAASLVWSGTMAIESDHNRTVQTAFPLSQVIPQGRSGAYLLVAEDAASATPDRFFTGVDKDDRAFDGLWANVPAHWVIATDIALSTMSGADGLHVSARSLASAEPLAGVRLSLIAAGQDVLGEATTDALGQAGFAPGLLRGKGANAAASVVAYSDGGDFAILDLNRPVFDLSDRGVAGRPVSGPVEAFLYTDRGIYRPGNTVELMTLLRDSTGNAIDTMPVTLILRRPDGLEARRFALPAQPAGGFAQAILLSRSAAQGLWAVEALIDPSGSPVGRAQFEVQDFVPQKLKVGLTSATPDLRPGLPLEVTVDGQFLYGAPAAGLKGEAELRVVRDPEPIPEAKGYRFGLVDEPVNDAVQKLAMPAADEAGHVRITDVVEPPRSGSAPLKGLLTAGLFEPGGRFVAGHLELPIRSQPLLIGIKPRFADDHMEEDKEATFDLRVFDQAGAVARSALHWRLVRENRIYDWFSTGGGWTWHYHVVDEPIANGEIDVPAGAPAVLGTAVQWGHYRLIVDDPATQAATSLRFAAGWQAASESADTPDKLEVTAEKPVIAPGETVRLRIHGPFAGKAQLTVASDRIFETREIAMPKDGAVAEVTASREWGAGAYVLVSLYRPLAEGRPHDPVRALGLAWLGIDPQPRTLSVAIGTPERVTPRRSLAVPIQVAGALGSAPTFVTLAAVDEGILQLTRFATPDPAKFLFGKRRLGIDLRDDYGRLLDGSAAAGAIREGGDSPVASASLAQGGKSHPLGGAGLAVVSTRIVALFSGPVLLDRDGSAQVMIDLPDFEGQLRLVALAYNHDAVGSGEAALTVRDPVVAELALPRFLAPGDSGRLALLLHNTEGEPGDYHLALAGSGAVKIVADHALDYALAAGDRRLDRVEIEGVDEGIGAIAADLSGPHGFSLHREWQIAVRAPHQPITLEQTAMQAPGEVFRIDEQKLRPFVPGSVTVSLDYAAFAGIDVPSLLQSLYRYPYGCTEQLSSSAFPLVYFNDPALLGAVPRDQGVKERVQQAIDTILDRQDAAGEFGLWHAGDGAASPWLNVYAVDFLTHAKAAGFVVPDIALQRSYGWVAQAVRRIGERNGGAYANAPDATRAYGQYVLARAGRTDLGELRRMHDTAQWDGPAGGQVVLASVRWGAGDLAEPLSLGQLAGALSLMGDHARAHSAFALAVANLDLDNYPRWWFDHAYYSHARDLAGLIAVSAETGNAPMTASLLDRFKVLSLSAEQLNTQEKAWLLVAAHALGTDTRARALSVNGKEVAELKLPAALSPSVPAIEAGYEVANIGERQLWRTLVIRGAPKLAPSAMAQGYILTKEYLGLDGRPVDPSHLVQNDRIIVSLAGRAEDGDHRTVLVDPLPAGWEIEATISRAEEYAFLGPLSKTSVVEARDDRFVAAFDLGDGFENGGRRRWMRYRERNIGEQQLDSEAFHLAYVARVVTPGHFALPEAVVEDMYRSGVMARTAAGETTADPR